jgi:hypothetical protein
MEAKQIKFQNTKKYCQTRTASLANIGVSGLYPGLYGKGHVLICMYQYKLYIYKLTMIILFEPYVW